MKKCTYCGKESPDENEVCPYDGQPLVPIPRAKPPPIPPPTPPRPPRTVPMSAPAAKKAPGLPGIAIAAIIIGGSIFIMIPIMAGLLIPALARAKSKAVQINCASNLKQIGLAARIWAGDHNGTFPKSFLEMTNELVNPSVLLCPADLKHPPPGQTDSMTRNPMNSSYEFLLPGSQEEQVTNQVIVRCPIHGTELLGDGSVHMRRRNTSR